MQSELKPCPFCGDNERGMNCLMGSWTVGCSCGVLGGEYETEAEAIAAWDTRASDAEITRLTEALRDAEERERVLRAGLERVAHRDPWTDPDSPERIARDTLAGAKPC